MAPLRVRGSVRVPGDKSISHRALLLAALADGECTISNVLVADDVAATARVLRGMGCDIPPLSPAMRVTGHGLRGLQAPSSALDCGNSGTTARLTAGIVAAHPFAARFTGDASLSRRPMQRVARPLQAMGASVELERGDGLPMTVRGGELRAVSWTLDAPSAQVKSAILLAALNAGVSAAVQGDGGSRDHTERLLRHVGVDVATEGESVRIAPAATVTAFDLDIPGDPSSAAYLAALAALADEATLEIHAVCINPRRTVFFDVLREMGARVEVHETDSSGPEPVGAVTVGSSGLRALNLTESRATRMIDELPLFACIASQAAGESSVTGAGELRRKESDRIHAVVSNLSAIGASAHELADGFVVIGKPGKTLRGRVTTHGDHRIAMAFGVLAALPGNEVQLDDRDCVAVSYPGFWDDMQRISA